MFFLLQEEIDDFNTFKTWFTSEAIPQIEALGGKCDTGDAAYSGGAWAHVYLEDKHGDDVLMDVFYANLDAMEPEDAFALAYGQTVEEFYVEFEQFLSLPLSQQLSILPSI